jgi:hypothetical protein
VPDALINWFSEQGVWGLLVVIVILFIVLYEKLERPIAKIKDLFSWVGPRWRRWGIKADIQSSVNLFSQSMDKEVPNTMPYNMKLKFVGEMDRAELFRDKNLVLVRIRDRRHDDKNFVHAMLTFCPVGVLPASRPYLDDSLSDAIDFTVTRKFLNKIQYQGALNYLYKEVIEPKTAETPELDKLCTILDRFDEQGLFTRVVLRELRDFAAKVRTRYPTDTHKNETRQFVEYMDVIAKRKPREKCETDFIGDCISMRLLMVGTVDTLSTKGIVGYLQAIQWAKGKSIGRVYIAARDDYIPDAERTAYLAKKQGLGRIVGKPKTYYATDTQGVRRENVLIEMRLVSSPFAPPEQGKLLEE